MLIWVSVPSDPWVLCSLITLNCACLFFGCVSYQILQNLESEDLISST